MALCQSKRPLTFLPRPLGDMFCKSEGLIQSGTHILSYCDDSFAMKLCPPIRTSWYRDALYKFSAVDQDLRQAVQALGAGFHRMGRSALLTGANFWQKKGFALQTDS